MRPGLIQLAVAALAVAVLAVIISPLGVTPVRARASARIVRSPRPSPPPPPAEPPRARPQGVTTAALAAYASAPSVDRGQTIDFAVSTSAPTYDVTVQRFAPGRDYTRSMLTQTGLPGRNQGYWVRGQFGIRACPTCVVSSRTGEVQPNWSWTFALRIPAAWPSGLYRAVFGSAVGQDAVPFVVRADGVSSPVLVVVSFNTYEAYNDWGGKSLYAYNSVGPRTVAGDAAAVAVSFLRPYASWEPTGAPVIGYGTASDWMLAAWLGERGIAADYVADVDVSADPAMLRGHRLVIFPGHAEYWSQAEMDAAVAVRDAGESLAFLGGNDVYWRIRYQDSFRTIVEYRRPQLDPLLGQRAAVTGLFTSPAIAEPQSQLTGTLYESGVPSYGLPWTVTAAAPGWLLQGTDLRAGDSVQHAVGGECDRYYSDAPQPPGVAVVAQTSFLHGRAVCSSTLYRAASSAWVFDAGDMDWDLHLLAGGAIATLTRNLLSEVLAAAR